MESAIKHLLDDLDALEAKYPEITDTDVREDLTYVVVFGFIERKKGFRFPQTFQLWNPLAIWKVRRTLKRFLSRTERIDSTPDQRFSAFFTNSPSSKNGRRTDEYFGWLDTRKEMIESYDGYSPPTIFKFGKAFVGALWTTLR
ncbi:MAG: hypothetical protein KJT03_03200 [Verrucomicrobiae bacterium]|nr:hypothetical protein [Verrucomicrobiae bacterium]